jgi:hypothetical protein
MNLVPGMEIFGSALWAAAKLRVAAWNRIASSRSRLMRVQLETLRSNLEMAKRTELGRMHEYARIETPEDFAACVPLRTYAEYEPMLERMRKGAEDVIWPGLIPYYGQSSGSSGTAAMHKFLPISRTQIEWQKKAGFDVLARYLDLTGDRTLTGGYHLGLLPPAVVRQDGPVGVASNPGIMQLHLPLAARPITLPKPPIREIPDYDKKMQAIADAYIDHDIRALSGTTCWFTIMFDRLLETAKNRGRNVSTVSELWPNLRVLFGGGVYAGPYRKVIDARIGRPTVLMDNYNATEGGIFAATDRLDDDGLIVIPDRGVYFEFVPRSEETKERPTRLPLWEVQTGVDYSVVVTTSSGLFAYVIGDYVRFKSIFPHRLVFAGRTSGMLSLTQELTTYHEIERAVAGAETDVPCTIVDFCASSEVGVESTGKGRYILFVEFDRDPSDQRAFVEAFDRRLITINRIYREHRDKNVAILPPVLVPLAKGASERFMEALGRTSVQNKFPRIIDEQKRDVLKAFARNGVRDHA